MISLWRFQTYQHYTAHRIFLCIGCVFVDQSGRQLRNFVISHCGHCHVAVGGLVRTLLLTDIVKTEAVLIR